MKNMNIGLALAMDMITKGNQIIMDWFYSHVEPEESIDDMSDNNKKSLCKECMKWYAEMGEYWIDDAVRIGKNIQWADSIIEKIKVFDA